MNERKIKLFREKLRRLERETGNVFEDRDDCCGVTLAQCHTLLDIGSKTEISLIDLADALGVDASTMSRTIQGLVLLGLVDRKSSDKDRRFVVISLSAQGRKVVRAIESRYNRYFNSVLEIIPENKQERIFESLSEFADAVRRLNEETGCCRKGRKP